MHPGTWLWLYLSLLCLVSPGSESAAPKTLSDSILPVLPDRPSSSCLLVLMFLSSMVPLSLVTLGWKSLFSCYSPLLFLMFVVQNNAWHRAAAQNVPRLISSGSDKNASSSREELKWKKVWIWIECQVWTPSSSVSVRRTQ